MGGSDPGRGSFADAMLDGADVGVVITNAEGIVTFVNRTAVELLRHEGGHRGRDVRDLLRLEDAPAALLGTASRMVREHVVASPGGDGHDLELELELSISRAEGSSHDAVGFFFIFRDLRLEMHSEAERRRMERLASVGTMVAGFAHEVRNPLAALRSLVESMAEDLVLEHGLRMPHVARMLNVLERVERLVRTSLQFGRPDPPRRGRHRPWVIVAEALSAIGSRARALGGEITVGMEPDLPDLVVDDGHVVQVLIILLNNALDAAGTANGVELRGGLASPQPGRPTARGSAPPAPYEIALEVIDDGPGVPPDLSSRIFDPFFTTKPAGTGLGLSIAQQLVSENGGRLEVTSVRGRTAFVVRLPAIERSPDYAAPEPSASPGPHDLERDRGDAMPRTRSF